MSPPAVRGRGTRHPGETVERGRERGGRETARVISCHTTKKCQKTPPVLRPWYDPHMVIYVDTAEYQGNATALCFYLC